MNRLFSIAAAAAALMSISAAGAQDSFGGASSTPAPTQQQQQSQPQQQPRQQQQPAPQQQQIQPNSQPQQQGFGQQQAVPPQGQQPGRGPNFAQVAQFESQDFGVPPSSPLHSGAMLGPTPTTIPGGLMITTEALWTTLQQNPGGVAIFDVLNGPEILPGALAAAPASAPGHFNDQTQREFAQFINQVTGGNKQTPVVFYCQSPQCWMSYNAALRAINMGYTQVLWYRGGVEAWKGAGLPTQNPQMGYQQ